jgi:hypothetical protein
LGCSMFGAYLSSERTREFMKFFSITFCKIRKSIPNFFAPQFLPNESCCVIKNKKSFKNKKTTTSCVMLVKFKNP